MIAFKKIVQFLVEESKTFLYTFPGQFNIFNVDLEIIGELFFDCNIFLEH